MKNFLEEFLTDILSNLLRTWGKTIYIAQYIKKVAFNPFIRHRRSIRLKGYDYSFAGLYFITICILDRNICSGKLKMKK